MCGMESWKKIYNFKTADKSDVESSVGELPGALANGKITLGCTVYKIFVLFWVNQ